MVGIFILLFVIAITKGDELNNLKLEQVLILSRHNLRTPLVINLEDYTPKIWPKFNGIATDLTSKGVYLESLMAEYITEWLESKDFVKGCPETDDVLIYSNTKARTRNTAKSFAKSVFHSCNIPFYHNDNIEIFDPVFHPIFHNNTDYFKQIILEEMKSRIEEKNLKQSYLELNRLIDLQNSEICKKESVCDLSTMNDEAIYREGEEPDVNGPLKIGTNVVDYFLMSFYEGFPLEDVAWGQINTVELWELLSKIIKQNLDVRFNTSAAQDIARPLLTYMFDIFKRGTPKFTVLIGHDSNLCSVINALGFKEFKLKNQYEPYPIGGKLVFQK